MKLMNTNEIQVGVVVWFRTGDMVPIRGGQLDQFALEKLHPYVCTGYNPDGGMSQWLFLTSDAMRGDAGRCFQSTDKEGDAFWRSKDSHFVRNNCVVVQNPYTVVRHSWNDPSLVVNRVKIPSLTRYGLETMATL